MNDMITCVCGCVWNARSFAECPKCEESAMLPATYLIRSCYGCGRPLDNGECGDVCEACHYREDAGR